MIREINMFFKSELEMRWDWFPNNMQLLESSKGVTSWNGKRVITVEGIKGEKSLDQFSKRLIRIGKENERTGYLWDDDRKYVSRLVQHARRLYAESDHLDTDTSASKVVHFLRSIRDSYSSDTIRKEIQSESAIINLNDYSHKRPEEDW